MPRVCRYLAEGYSYHVLNRGNGKQKIFHKDQDFAAFVQIMKEAIEHFSIDIFAYCLMPNHFHLVLMPNRPDHLSMWMHWLMSTHANRYRQHYKTTGHLWQGRFKSFIIQNDKHLLTALRYVEGNAVRAGLVFSAKDWFWSSLQERLGGKKEKIINCPPVELPSDWMRFVDEPLTERELEKIRQSVVRQTPFGNHKWQKRISQNLNIESTLRPRGRPRKESGKKSEE